MTELLDRRAFAADTVVIHLRGDLPAAPGPIAEALVVHDGLILEDVLYRLSDSGGGSAGQTQLDLLLDGATLYPSAAQDDHRPAWPSGRWGIENIANLDKVPAAGATIVVGLPKVKDASGGPARIFALI